MDWTYRKIVVTARERTWRVNAKLATGPPKTNSGFGANFVGIHGPWRDRFRSMCGSLSQTLLRDSWVRITPPTAAKLD
jgi:hypothetical protein